MQCTCVTDSFAPLPPELRPRPRKKSSLRKTTCPGCGLVYWTNRPTDQEGGGRFTTLKATDERKIASSRREDHTDEMSMAKLSYRQILVGRAPAGMRGLDELFDELYEQGRRPDEAGLGMELVERVRAYKNYIPKPAVDDFARALLREYRKYADQRAGGGKPQPVNYRAVQFSASRVNWASRTAVKQAVLGQ